MAFSKEPMVDDRNDSQSHDNMSENNDSEQQEVAAALEQQRKQELAACAQELSHVKETCKCIAADFENFKKRVERDRVMWTHSAQAEVLRDLLPVVDDFDRAFGEYEKNGNDAQRQAWIAGFDLIRKALTKFLQTNGVTAMDQVQLFDPELHEAIAQVASPVHESGAIVDVVQKGYMLNGQVLRVARVTVAK